MPDREAIKILVREEHKEEFEEIEREILELIIENNEIRNENNKIRNENSEIRRKIKQLNEMNDLTPEARKIINCLNESLN